MSEPHPVSFARTAMLSCPVCNKRFPADVWLIVDVAERADLVERSRSGRLHHFACPEGHTVEADEPLLLYFRGQVPSALFVRTIAGSDEEVADRAAKLLGVLRERAGQAWCEASLADGLPIISWPSVPVALTEGPGAVIEHRDQLAEDAAELQRALAEIDRLSRPEDIPRRVEYIRSALTLVSRDKQALLWAVLQVALGDALTQNWQVIRGENLHQAIGCYQAALLVYTREAFPDRWATTQNNLGNAYSFLPGGDRQQNIQRAIACYEQSLLVYTREAFPDRWATTQNNLGVAYSHLPRGNRQQNLQRAIACYQQALTIRTREAVPAGWAMTLNNLGNAYSYLPGGDRQQNLQRAIAYYQQALTVRTHEAFPTDWAMTQNHLGNAYSYLPGGDRQQNLQRAIACYEQSLTVLTREAFPADWAMTQNHLGNAYRHLPGGNRQQNLQRAIACYEQSLLVYTREAFPAGWAMTQNHLGCAYSDLPGGDRQQNLQHAIACYEQSLLVYTREAFPAGWATSLNNLGNAHSDLPGGDRQQNLERAIACYEQSLLVYTREAFPDRWATTLNNLGATYSHLPGGDRQQSLEQAIACYEQALLVYTREAISADWAKTQNNLGNAYSYLPGGDRQQNLQRAIARYQQALTMRTREAFPADWAMTLNNLGAAYSDLPGGDRQQNLEQAITCFQDALLVYTREAFPAEWATTLNNLANAYKHLPGGNLRAIEVWQEVINHFHDIIRTSVEPLHLAAQAAKLVRRVVLPLLELERTADVVSVLEQGRAIGLRLELTRTHRTPTGLTPVEILEYRELSATARDIPSARRQLEALPLQTPDRAAGLVDLGQRYEKVLARVRELEERDPTFPLDPPSYAHLTRLAAEHDLTLVYLQPTDEPTHGAVGMAIHPGSPPDAPDPTDVVRLIGLSAADVTDILFRTSEGASFAAEHFHALLAAGEHSRQLGWFPAYGLKDAAREIWHGTIRSVVDRLGRALAPLIDRLRQVHAKRVVLLPGGRLPLLPLHAIPVSGARDGVEVFGEEFTISYAPSAVALSLSLDRAQLNRSCQPCLTAIANPEGALPPLPFADEEVIAVAARFGGHAQVARGRDATRTWLDPRAADAHFLELATHASFVLDAPSGSRMTLAPGGPKAGLSLDDLWGGRFGIREGCVVTASACETGQIDFRGESDESLGFPAAFLGLGASSVIASLWAVNDLSTALLMDKVYEFLLRRGCSSAAAVQEASHWLRRLPREKVRHWLESRHAAVEEELERLNVPRGGVTPEGLAAEEALEDRLHRLADALDGLDDQPDPPFAHPVYWAAFAAYGA
jgi:CHAT domain-containing protein/tetratricopeptide (TPR) repeat protein